MRICDITEETKYYPSDFNNSRYHCLNCYNRKHQTPVLVMMSNDCDYPHWLVVDGTKQMVYRSYDEAMDYCKRQGYVSKFL